jgi:CarD family transcriptional regulator
MTEKKAKDSVKTNKSKIRTFKVGDLAVYPAHGVGEIISIESRVVNGEIPKVYAVMQSKKEANADNQTWNRRYREYMDKIKTGSLYDVAEVFRDLFLLKLTKDLSFGERKLYDTAQILLVKELSTAKKTDENAILTEIESLFVSEEAEN